MSGLIWGSIVCLAVSWCALGVAIGHVTYEVHIWKERAR